MVHSTQVLLIFQFQEKSFEILTGKILEKLQLATSFPVSQKGVL